MRPMLCFIAAALTLAPALAQQWRPIPGAPGNSLAVDMMSIKREGTWRMFRTRAVASSTGQMFALMAIDCKAGTIEFRAQRAYQAGKLVRERTFPAGRRPRQTVPNPAGDPLIRLVCAV